VSVKKFCKGAEPFYDFPEYELGIRCSSQIVDRCTGSYYAWRQTNTNYFETGAILHSCRLIQPNVSDVMIIVIIAAKAKFSTTETQRKCLQINAKCDTDGQPEIAIWSPKPEVLISPKVWQITSKFQRQTCGCRQLRAPNNDRQPEMAADTGNAYISETMKDVIKISMTNLAFTTTESSKKVSASNCSSDRQLQK